MTDSKLPGTHLLREGKQVKNYRGFQEGDAKNHPSYSPVGLLEDMTKLLAVHLLRVIKHI